MTIEIPILNPIWTRKDLPVQDFLYSDFTPRMGFRVRGFGFTVSGFRVWDYDEGPKWEILSLCTSPKKVCYLGSR